MKKYLYLILFFLVCVPAIAGTINSYTLKSPPDDADTLVIYDSDDGSTKKTTVGDISGSSSSSGINWSAYTDLTSLSSANEFIVNDSGTSKSINWDDLKSNISSGVNWSNIDSLRTGYNVMAFGAVGDGVTDDTSAIQSAINTAAAVGGGTVYFPRGIYSTSDLTYYSTVSLLGENRTGSILKARAGTTNILYWTNLLTDTFTPLYGYIRNLQFDGNSVSGVTGIRALNSPFLTIENVRVHHCDIGLYATGNYLTNITGSRFNVNRIGVYFAPATLPSSTTLPQEITISHSSLTANTEWGLKSTRNSNLILTSIDVEQNGTDGDMATGGILMEQLTGAAGQKMGLIVKNAWFEANRGQADIQIETTTNTDTISLVVDSSNFDEYTISGTRSQYYIYSPNTYGHVFVSNTYFEGGIDNYVVGEYKTLNVAATNTNNAYRPEIFFAVGQQDGYLSELPSSKHLSLINTSTSASNSGAAILMMSSDQAALSDGDRMGALNWAGSSAAGESQFSPRIQAFADGTWTSSSVPSKLTFDTVPSGSTTRAERLTIRATGNVGIGTANPTKLLCVGSTCQGSIDSSGNIIGVGFTSSGNVGISTTAPTTCGCKQFTNGLCTTVGTCS